MTTRSWSSTSICNNDADYRALGVELSTKLAEVGLVKTADTGQINWSTVLRPTGANAVAGYEVWRFDDELQATAPVFIKIEYCNYGAANVFGMFITVGTGTDGAGSVTGIIAPKRMCGTGSFGSYTAGSYPSYLCYAGGALGLAHKVGAFTGADSITGFSICRTCDTAGDWTGDGLVVYYRTQQNNQLNSAYADVLTLRFAAPASVGVVSAGGYCLVPHGRTATIDGDNPVYLHWMPAPQMVPVLGICTHVASHYALGSFTATLVGATPRTYLSFGSAKWMGRGAENAVTSFSLAMLWE